jgi:hypothetical protein
MARFEKKVNLYRQASGLMAAFKIFGQTRYYCLYAQVEKYGT